MRNRDRFQVRTLWVSRLVARAIILAIKYQRAIGIPIEVACNITETFFPPSVFGAAYHFALVWSEEECKRLGYEVPDGRQNQNENEAENQSDTRGASRDRHLLMRSGAARAYSTEAKQKIREWVKAHRIDDQ